MDLGAPASYLTLAEGTDVFSSDGEKIGAVEHVLADADADVFDGLPRSPGSTSRASSSRSARATSSSCTSGNY